MYIVIVRDVIFEYESKVFSALFAVIDQVSFWETESNVYINDTFTLKQININILLQMYRMKDISHND